MDEAAGRARKSARPAAFLVWNLARREVFHVKHPRAREPGTHEEGPQQGPLLVRLVDAGGCPPEPTDRGAPGSRRPPAFPGTARPAGGGRQPRQRSPIVACGRAPCRPASSVLQCASHRRLASRVARAVWHVHL